MHTYKVRKNLDENERNELIGFHDIVAHLLFHRGIKNKDDAEVFLSPKYDKGIHDPFLLHDMDKAVDRILKAIKKKEKICIYSDYDADGVPGAAILTDFFEKVEYKNYALYIPNRETEGFGLSNKAIDVLQKDGCTLIITIDCGITDVEEVLYAKSLGVECIITDHHLPGDVLPQAFAIIDTKQKDCKSGVNRTKFAGLAYFGRKPGVNRCKSGVNQV